MGVDVQNLTYFNPRQRVETTSKRQKMAVFWARMTPQDELFFCGDFEHYFYDEPKFYPLKQGP